MATRVSEWRLRDPPAVHREAREGDHRMAAHGGIALVVDEKHREIGALEVGLDRKHAIHVVMAPGLEHEEPAIAVEMLAGVAALGEDGRARDGGIAGDHQAHGFAARVHLHRLDIQGHGIASKIPEARRLKPGKSTDCAAQHYV